MKNLSNTASNAAALAPSETETERENNHWISSLVISVACALIILIAYEWSLRAAGVEPNFRDSQARWSSVREVAGTDRDRDAIAILGASRIRAAISLNELERRYPDQAIYPLGYIGRAPCAALQDLAENTEFRGTVIVSLSSNWVDCQAGPNQMHDVVARYHGQWNWARKIDAWASNLVTQSLVATDPDHSFRSMFKNAIEPATPVLRAKYEITRQNRQLEMDFSRFSQADLAQMQEHSVWAFRGRVATDAGLRRERWSAGLDAFNAAIETITARDGQVILVKLPTSGPLVLVEEEAFPRAQFWDEMARRIPATAVLHYQDYPAISSFATPDGNHLDFRDAAAFTTALFDALEHQGVTLSR